MRTIDADALTNDCKRYLNTLNPERDGKECARIHWLIGVLKNASTVEPERWIPVSERLPHEKGEYLVTYRSVLYGDVLDSEDKVGFDTFRGKTSWAKKENQTVIAWKPKPKPYCKDF